MLRCIELKELNMRFFAYFVMIAAIFSTLLYLNLNRLDEINADKKVIEQYKAYNQSVEVIKARNTILNINSRITDIQRLRAICLTDVPKDEQGTQIYQIQYCTGRALKAMRLPSDLEEIQKLALHPLPSDSNKGSCTSPVIISPDLYNDTKVEL